MHTSICLIGSTKVESIFREYEVKLSFNGYIVLSPLVYNQTGDIPGCGVENKKILDYVQKEKIRMSDIVFVIDENNYIGASTNEQINYAKLLNKPILKYSNSDINKLIKE